jgi:DASH complex subunit SPC19
MSTGSSAASLAASVSSLRSSLSLLDSSIAILDAGISDFPRLSTVLTTTRVRFPWTIDSVKTYTNLLQHFELTPASNLDAARASLASELGPAINTLLNRAESHCAKLERREQTLIAKSELQEGRLSQSSGAPERKPTRSSNMGSSGGEKALRYVWSLHNPEHT